MAKVTAPEAEPMTAKVTPSLSIIIPTFGRNQVLWQTVRDLQPQIQPGDELWVIDQNNPPLSVPADLAAAWLHLGHLDLPSLTRARNLGMRLAGQELLVFLDDDIIPDPNLLEAFRTASVRHPGCILTGIVDQTDKVEDIPSPGFIDLHTGEIRTNFSRALNGEIPFFPGGLALIPRSCLPPAPSFCPHFRGASQGEEIDFALRIKRKGRKIISDPGIRVFHLKAQDGGCRSEEFRRSFFMDQVFNQGLFFGRHGLLFSLPACLHRLKGFIEFHSRRPGRRSHSLALVLGALIQLGWGLMMGIALRVRQSWNFPPV